jgi:YidC/Oxa1 family membrane protein insertase
LYWFSNNIWTFGQQHYVFNMIEKEDEAKKQEVIERRAANAPSPGAKPKRAPKAAPTGSSAADTAVADDGSESDDGDGERDGDGQRPDGRAAKAPLSKADKTSPPGHTNGPNGGAPRPGVRPSAKRRKR